MKEIAELKANSSSDEIRNEVLKRLVKCDCEINLIIIDKKQIIERLYNAKNKLYNYVFGLLIEDVNLNKTSIEIFIDKKDSNRLLREDLDQYIQSKVKAMNSKTIVKIKHLQSHAHKALQVVDFVAWAAHRKYSFKQENYLGIIKAKIKNTKELWKK